MLIGHPPYLDFKNDEVNGGEMHKPLNARPEPKASTRCTPRSTAMTVLNPLRRLSTVALLAAQLLGASAHAASNNAYVDMFCIYNSTDRNINFEYRGGSGGNWHSGTVKVNEWFGAWWPNGTVDHAEIRFDSDMSGDDWYEDYVLDLRTGMATSCSNNGKDYHFDWWEDSRYFIDLYDGSGR
ncbi:hypothetical protein GCM10008949_47040 [Deinococcus humi]|nr:hypothetical protein GCM10008949_47040 [Deinococcus humi]